jgi:transposase InsO family protein
VIVINELRHEFKLDDLLAFAGIPRSTFYYHLKKLQEPDKYAKTKEQIAEIYHTHKGRYGYRRITLELRRLGKLINHKTVLRLMGELGLKSMVRIKKYRSYRGKVGKIAPNILNRDFNAKKPNQKWLTDISVFTLLGQKLYFSPMLDLYNGEIISYTLSRRPTFDQTMDMLNKALHKTPDCTGLTIHSDQGWQYQMRQYQERLQDRNITQSMSRKGNCLDNAPMESFFGIIKSELLYLQTFDSIERFTKELQDYIDYYNNHRIKVKLKGLSPVEYRTQSSLTAA